MDFDLRLKALSRLAQSTTEAAEPALRKELEKVAASLALDTEYDHLVQQLDILETIGHRFSGRVIEIGVAFVQAIESRQITYSVEDSTLEAQIAEYQNASTLIVRMIEVLGNLRYLETKTVLNTFLHLSQHKLENVRTKAIEGLGLLARYDLSIVYGEGKRPGIGATPQKIIIDELELLTDEDQRKHFSAVLVLVKDLLSPTIHGTSWSYKSVILSQGATPAHPDIADIRLRGIQILKDMYGKATGASQKLGLIQVFNEATRIHGIGSTDEHLAKMIVRDSVVVLKFYADLIPAEELHIIQKIEDGSYWIYYHAIRREIREAALAVADAIRQHSEYQIYKILIGFEGKFGDWSDLRNDDGSGEDIDKLRKEKALEYAAGITSKNYEEWRQRIVKYAQTESNDLATFPIFYHFLEAFAAAQPNLALQMVSVDSELIKGFLIPLLRSLWAGSKQSATRNLVSTWIEQGQYLWQCTRLFLDNELADRPVLKLILHRATEMDDRGTIAAVISVAVSNYTDNKPWLIDDLFLPALQVLTDRSTADWIFDVWFRRGSRPVIKDLSERGIDLVLKNLLVVKTIDYHAEEVLYLIAQKAPQKVLQFLCKRLAAHSGHDENLSSPFEAIPYRLHKLNEPLSKIPGEAVRVVREQYDGDYGMLIFRGAQLLKTIFPQFAPEFEAELLNIVRSGGDENYEFVLAVLRNYEGEPFIHKVCKELVKVIPLDSPLRTEIAISLESTGVVSGEFGLPEAYERKKREVCDWLTDPNEKVQEFAKWYIANLEKMSVAERKRAEERIALRKHRYEEQ
jgi:hypothetical protein